MEALIVPVILCGGGGTRLWPLSRKALPKQFIPMFGQQSTFVRTLKRVSDPLVFAPPIIVSGSELCSLIRDEMSGAKIGGRIVLEPLRRDSGAAVAVACHIAMAEDRDAVLLVLAADHLVQDVAGFVESIRAGHRAALDGNIIAFGVRPEGPETGYGYIEPTAFEDGVQKIARFLEKPALDVARELIENGCLWNSGNFLFKASVMLQELAHFAPDMHAVAAEAVNAREITLEENIRVERLDAGVFARSPMLSIDHAVMEKTTLGKVVSVSHDWSDLGTWQSIWAASEKDCGGNVKLGHVTVANVNNSYVSSEGPHVAVLGLDDVVVVAATDAVLVAPLHAASELKQLVTLLDRVEKTRRLTERHQRNHEPWGWDETLTVRADYLVKHLHVRPGASVTLNKRAHCLVASGKCAASFNGEVRSVLMTQSFTVRDGDILQIANAQDEELEIIVTEFIGPFPQS